jgi:hypothetical protein
MTSSNKRMNTHCCLSQSFWAEILTKFLVKYSSNLNHTFSKWEGYIGDWIFGLSLCLIYILSLIVFYNWFIQNCHALKQHLLIDWHLSSKRMNTHCCFSQSFWTELLMKHGGCFSEKTHTCIKYAIPKLSYFFKVWFIMIVMFCVW